MKILQKQMKKSIRKWKCFVTQAEKQNCEHNIFSLSFYRKIFPKLCNSHSLVFVVVHVDGCNISIFFNFQPFQMHTHTLTQWINIYIYTAKPHLSHLSVPFHLKNGFWKIFLQWNLLYVSGIWNCQRQR